ncbi:hypothetical protein C0J52_14266 [Blattella germanica]|nr:hypothetical protein C0J52_14266 [Blattella germanica]
MNRICQVSSVCLKSVTGNRIFYSGRFIIKQIRNGQFSNGRGLSTVPNVATKERKPMEFKKKLPTDGRPLYLDAQATTPMASSNSIES